MRKEHTDNKDLNRTLFLITFAGITPLIIIFITYTSNPKFYLISIIFDNTQNIPSIISAYNPVMTKVMDIYGKSAPLLALIAFYSPTPRQKARDNSQQRKTNYCQHI